jgi:hypothetical protein
LHGALAAALRNNPPPTSLLHLAATKVRCCQQVFDTQTLIFLDSKRYTPILIVRIGSANFAQILPLCCAAVIAVTNSRTACLVCYSQLAQDFRQEYAMLLKTRQVAAHAGVSLHRHF